MRGLEFSAGIYPELRGPFLRLVDANVDWQDRTHFLAVAARVNAADTSRSCAREPQCQARLRRPPSLAG